MTSLPNFIYGTAWKKEATTALVELALQSGFRAIDTANQAKHYLRKAGFVIPPSRSVPRFNFELNMRTELQTPSCERVRILTPSDGTEAVTRVQIESTDEAGNKWTTIGVSQNIVDASFRALHDSITYRLMRG